MSISTNNNMLSYVIRYSPQKFKFESIKKLSLKIYFKKSYFLKILFIFFTEFPSLTQINVFCVTLENAYKLILMWYIYIVLAFIMISVFNTEKNDVLY